MRILKVGGLLAVLSLTTVAAACSSESANSVAAEEVTAAAAEAGTTADTDSTSDSITTTTAAESTASSVAEDAATATGGGRAGGGPGGVSASSVATVDDLVALIQEAYGDGGLGLHRGHQPVEDVLNEVLTISHDELHVRMDAGQNLAAVAEDLGIDPDTLISALVDSWSPAIDNLAAAGVITEDEAAQYLEALREAFTFRVTWNGEDAIPTFSGI